MMPQSTSGPPAEPNISVRPLQENDLPAADHIMRLAFGTFLGLPEPTSFMGDADYVRTRWFADNTTAFGAEMGETLIGSNFATNWGSVGFFGPLTVHPDHWSRGVGRQLMEPIMDCFEKWGTKHAGLFTFAQSPKHVGLYQKFGFWPRFLTAIMSRPVEPTEGGARWTTYSSLREDERESTLPDCYRITDAIYEGLDVGPEVQAVDEQKLGDTLFLTDEGGLTGIAICHCGPGTEAGSDVCYIKFGASRPGSDAEVQFSRLLAACQEMASQRGLSRIVAGMNLSRHEAYGVMLAHGYRSTFQGVAMHKPNEPGYNRPGVYVIDDWR